MQLLINTSFVAGESRDRDIGAQIFDAVLKSMYRLMSAINPNDGSPLERVLLDSIESIKFGFTGNPWSVDLYATITVIKESKEAILVSTYKHGFRLGHGVDPDRIANDILDIAAGALNFKRPEKAA